MGVDAGKKQLIGGLIEESYARIREGGFSKAEDALEEALKLDFEDTEVISALKSIHFWLSKIERLESIHDSFERGEYLLKQWESYRTYARETSEICRYAFRHWVFGNSLLCFKEVLEETGSHEADILFRVGTCYKGLGDYQSAVEYFEAANRQRVEDPQTIAELADCYAFINEDKAAKIFFREAFFIDPSKIDVDALESLLIRRLVEKLTDIGMVSPALEEWLPVYGVLYGIFNIKRELKPLEYGKLKQSIFTLENRLLEVHDGARGEIVPRLINRYFWLIDHYLGSNDSREKIEQVLRKVKQLDNDVYDLYIQ